LNRWFIYMRLVKL